MSRAGYHDIGASLGRLDGLCNRRDLHHHQGPDIVSLPHQIARVSKRERDNGRPRLQRVAKGLGVQCLRNVIDRKRPARQPPHDVDVAFDGGCGSEERSDTTQPARVGYGSRKLR